MRGEELTRIEVRCKSLQPSGGCSFTSPFRERYHTQCAQLHRAAIRGDWQAAEQLIHEEPSLITSCITEGGETALHIAAIVGHVHFVAQLLEKMTVDDTEIQNDKGSTAIAFAALNGNVRIAELLVEKNPGLPAIRGDDGFTPLYMAALLGHGPMVNYLFPFSEFECWSIEERASLLSTCIDSALYGIATNIVKLYPVLVVAQDSDGETPLEVLARKPSDFSNPNRFGMHILDLILYYTNLTGEIKLARGDACTLLICIWEIAIRGTDEEVHAFIETTSKMLFMAAKLGNREFLVELIRRYPDFLYKMNERNHSIFHVAVENRYVDVFKIIHQIGGLKDFIATYVNPEDNSNMLHLAARLGPQSQIDCICGAALQMQQEVLWYQEVKKIVQPAYRNMKNSEGQTPYNLFLDEHKNLMEQGEKWMKKTSQSCMVVVTLIATVVFAAALTVPGGYNNNTGTPVMLYEHKELFKIFSISEVVAMLSSSTSILMFLSILTSRYMEADFLYSLPVRLMIGLTMLFVSVVAMLVGFCTTCLLSYPHGFEDVLLLLGAFATVPVMFILLKYQLVVEVLRSTYSSRYLFKSSSPLFV